MRTAKIGPDLRLEKLGQSHVLKKFPCFFYYFEETDIF